MRAIEKTFPSGGLEIDSFRADVARVEAYLTRDFGPEVRGLALFACAGRALFEEVAVGLPFENMVAIGASPDLFQLAGCLDGLETALVALVNTATARLCITRRGWLAEIAGSDDRPKSYGQRAVGSLSQAHIQRHADGVRAQFAPVPTPVLAPIAICGVVLRHRVIMRPDDRDDEVLPARGGTRSALPNGRAVRAPKCWGWWPERQASFSSATPHGGNEQALQSMLTMLMHLGLLVVTPGQRSPILEQPAAPYGATAITGHRGSALTTDEADEARDLGQRVAIVAGWLRAGRAQEIDQLGTVAAAEARDYAPAN